MCIITHFFEYGYFYYKLHYTMKKGKSVKKIDRAFKKHAKNKFLSPQSCTRLSQTRLHIFELNKIIKHLEKKFNYVPSSAQLLFYKYNNKQERMLFEKYMEMFSIE